MVKDIEYWYEGLYVWLDIYVDVLAMMGQSAAILFSLWIRGIIELIAETTVTIHHTMVLRRPNTLHWLVQS